MLALRDKLRATFGGLPSAFWTLWLGMLVNRLASFVVMFLALYLTRERGFAADAAGRVVALYGLGVLIAGPLGGALADRAGRRRTMLLGLGLGGACVGALAFARAPWALAALAFLAALTGEQYRPAAQAVVADVVPPADRARAFGLLYWVINLGFTLGVVIAGLVAERSLRALFVIDALTSFAFAALVFWRLPETRPQAPAGPAPRRQGLGALRDRDLVRFLALHFVTLVVFTQFQLALPLDLQAHGFGPRAFAILMGVNGVGVIVLQPLVASRLRQLDAGVSLALAAALIGAGFGVNAVAGSLPAYALGVLLWTIGEVLSFPVAAALVAALSPTHLRGAYQGAFTMALGLAFTLSPVVGGEVMTRFGAPTLWLASIVVSLLVAAGHLAIAVPRRRRLALQYGGAGVAGLHRDLLQR